MLSFLSLSGGLVEAGIPNEALVEFRDPVVEMPAGAGVDNGEIRADPQEVVSHAAEDVLRLAEPVHLGESVKLLEGHSTYEYTIAPVLSQDIKCLSVQRCYNGQHMKPKKNKAAVSLGKLRVQKGPSLTETGRLGGLAAAKNRTQAERQAFAASGGHVGGQARAQALSAERRKEIARKAAAKRWGKD